MKQGKGFSQNHFSGMGDAPGLKVSVITAVLNECTGLERTLSSIISQSWKNTEVIVVDGGSTDGSLSVIQRYSSQLAYWVSEPDDGIADAMNKGVAQATGDLVLFLHAGDHFPGERTLASALERVTESDSVWAFDILHGNADRLRRCSPRPFNYWVRIKNPLPHQGVLCPRAVFELLGGFDRAFKITMDYDFWLRAYRADLGLRRVPEVLAIMNDSGISSRRDWPSLAARFREERVVQARHAVAIPWNWIYRLYWPLYLAYRRLRALK